MSLEATAERARFRNALVAQRSARALEKRQVDMSHIMRLDATKLAATAALLTAQRMSSEMPQRATRQPVELQRSSSARSIRSEALIDERLRQRRALLEHEAMLMQRARALELSRLSVSHRPARAACSYISCMTREAKPLEAFRPPPVKIPADELLYYLS